MDPGAETVDWLVLVGILVVRHGQTLKQAWRFTMGEFLAVVNLEGYINAHRSDGWDRNRLRDFEADLRERGLI